MSDPLTDAPFDLFWRNPRQYGDQLVSLGECNVSWDKGILDRYNIDQQKWSRIKFGPLGKKWRSYSVGLDYTVEYDADSGPGRPRGVYPTWDFNALPIEELDWLIQNPWGDDLDFTTDLTIPFAERPVKGQPHRIFITNVPASNTLPGRKAIVLLADVQRKRPDVELHMHRQYDYGVLFGNGFKSGSLEPFELAGRGNLMFPDGSRIDVKTPAAKYMSKKTRAFGWEVTELAKEKTNRVLFNIQTGRFASLHWKKDYKTPLNVPSDHKADSVSASADVAPLSIKRLSPGLKGMEQGDRIICNVCSLKAKCGYYREGSVCTVPGSQMKKLAEQFKTTNPDAIKEGMRQVLERQANVVDERLQDHESRGQDDIDPNLMKDMNSLFANAHKLYQLERPKPGMNLNIGINASGVTVQGNDPRQIAAHITAELEAAHGVGNVTDEMVMQRLQEYQMAEASRPKIIEQ